MKKNKISKNWINKQRRDIYVRQSKVEGYRSRAVYKLKEINEKFKFLKNNISVIDLGAAPGSWSQYISSNLKCNNGYFVSKLFMGTSFNEIIAFSKKNFVKFNVYKPPASRKDSKESFLICKNLR